MTTVDDLLDELLSSDEEDAAKPQQQAPGDPATNDVEEGAVAATQPGLQRPVSTGQAPQLPAETGSTRQPSDAAAPPGEVALGLQARRLAAAPHDHRPAAAASDRRLPDHSSAAQSQSDAGESDGSAASAAAAQHGLGIGDVAPAMRPLPGSQDSRDHQDQPLEASAAKPASTSTRRQVHGSANIVVVSDVGEDTAIQSASPAALAQAPSAAMQQSSEEDVSGASEQPAAWSVSSPAPEGLGRSASGLSDLSDASVDPMQTEAPAAADLDPTAAQAAQAATEAAAAGVADSAQSAAETASELTSLDALSSMGLDDEAADGSLVVPAGSAAQQTALETASLSSLSSLSAAPSDEVAEPSSQAGGASAVPGLAMPAAAAEGVGAGSAEPHPADGNLLPLQMPDPATAASPPAAVTLSTAPAHQPPGQQSVLESSPADIGVADPTSLPDATSDLHRVRLPPLSTADTRPAAHTRSFSEAGTAASQPASVDTAAAQHPPEPPAQHMVALAQAEELERSLLTGPQRPAAADGASRRAALRSSLAAERSSLPAQGLADRNGNTVGRIVLLRVDRALAVDSQATDQQRQALGTRTAVAVAAQHALVAVGMSSGVVCLQMPWSSNAPEGGASRAGRVVTLGDARPGDREAVSALTFNASGSMLLAGHVSGAVVLWQWHRSIWEAVKTIRDAHAAAVSACVFLDGASQAALTADTRGRLVFHNVTAYISIMGRLTKAAAPVPLLQGRSLGPICILTTLTHIQAPAAQEAAAAESLVMLGGPHAIYVCSCAPDGRFVILHTIARPPDAPPGCIPYAAWHLKAPQQGAVRKFMEATVAMAWDCQIVLVDVPVLPATPLQGRAPESGEDTLLRSVMGLRARLPDAAGLGSSTSSSSAMQPEASTAPGQPALPPARMVHMWSVPQPAAGIAWLAARRLAVISSTAADATLRLYSGPNQVQDTVQLSEPLAGRSLGFDTQSGLHTVFHNALCTQLGRLALLCQSGVRMVRQLAWPERVATLCSLEQWAPAVDIALQWHAATTADGSGGDDAGQVASSLVQALQGYIDSVLAEGSLANADEAQTSARLRTAAEVVIKACILVSRLDILWEDVFPRFQAYAAADAFLAALQPHILADEVPSPAPEVVQALVEHCVVRGQPEQVERCVLHMDIASLDFSQVVKLCRTHHLYSALTYILTRGLDDYIAPAVELLLALAIVPGSAMTADADQGSRAGKPVVSEVQQAAGYKLLVYVRCCLSQQQFPPGAGPLPATKAGLVKAGMLGLLLYATPVAMFQLWRSLGGSANSTSPEQLQQALPGPHSALRRLVAFHPAASLAVLQEGLAGWDALDSDLLDAAAPCAAPPPGGPDARSATQAVVDAVAVLLSEGAFSKGQGAPDAAKGAHDAHSSQTAWALDFLATHLGDGRATAAPETVMKVLGYLAGGPWLPEQAAPAAELREQRFINVVKHASSYTPGHTARLDAADVARVRALALQAHFLRAEAMTLHQAGDYGAAITSLLRSASDAASAVKYIEDTLDDVEMGSPRRAGAFRTAVLQAMVQLTAADARAAAGLILRRMPREHAAIVHSMGPQPELQFKYLKGALEVAQNSDSDGNSSASAALAALDRGDGPASSSRGGAAAVHGALMAREDTCELYVRLLCQYERRAVLPFLQSHGSYRVDACMGWCREAGVHDAEAYLLEHFLGDYAAALRICLAHVDRCNAQLVAAVRCGAVVLTTGTRLRSGSSDVGALFHGSTGVSSPPAAARSLRRGAEAVSREVASAAAARQAAVDLCQRCAGDTASNLDAEDLWFPLLQCYIRQLQDLRRLEQELPPQPPSPAVSPAARAGPSLMRLRSIEQPGSPLALIRTGSTPVGREPGLQEQLQALQALFTSFMEVIISQMAGYIPLQAIGDRLLGQLEVQRWGECRGTLLGLLAAYNYEAGILAAAARLLCGDAARDLAAAYRSRLRGRPAAVSAATAAGGLPAANGSGAGASPSSMAPPAHMATGPGAIGGSGGDRPEEMRRKMALLELSDSPAGAAAGGRSRQVSSH